MESGIDLLVFQQGSLTVLLRKANQCWCSTTLTCAYVRQIFYLFVCFSVVLMENGDVYTFGYGQHGQLGHGDVNSR